MWLISQILSSWKSSVCNCVSLCCTNTMNCLFKHVWLFLIFNGIQFPLLCLCIIKLQRCHLLPYQVPQFSRIWDQSPAQSCEQSPYLHTTQEVRRQICKSFFHVYFIVMSDICYTDLSICGWSFTLRN